MYCGNGMEVEKGILVNYVNDTVIALSELTNHPIPLVVDIDKEFNACKCRQLCIYCGEDVEKEIMTQLPNLTVSRWNPYFADVNVADTNKASGMADIADYLGFSLDESMAFGDGGNDIPMLRAAGTGIEVRMTDASETLVWLRFLRFLQLFRGRKRKQDKGLASEPTLCPITSARSAGS